MNNNDAWHKVCQTIIDYWVAPDMRTNAQHMLKMAMIEAETNKGGFVGESIPVAEQIITNKLHKAINKA